MAAVQPLRVSPEPRDVDHIVMLNGLSWNDYEAVLRMRGDRSAPRICFCEGTLEIMSPSRYHEADNML